METERLVLRRWEKDDLDEELGLDRIIAIAMPENAASLRVMAKLGMTEAQQTWDEVRQVSLVVHEITRT